MIVLVSFPVDVVDSVTKAALGRRCSFCLLGKGIGHHGRESREKKLKVAGHTASIVSTER